MYYNRDNRDVILILLLIGFICFVIYFICYFIKEKIKQITSSIKYKKEYEELSKKLPSLEKNLRVEYYSLIKKKEIEYDKNKTKIRLIEAEKEKLILEKEIKKDLSDYILNDTMIYFYTEYSLKKLKEIENLFINKKNPSFKSSEYIKSIKKEFTNLIIENRDLKLKLSSLSGEIEKNIEAIEDDKFGKIENYDEIISKEKIDFKNLKYYEILDYYLKKYKEKNKSKLRIGYEFERYCGYLLEQLGFSVRYHGIINGKSDEGIDLIAEKNKKIVYVQCKYWSITKTIRENTVAQLLGATLKKFLETGKKTEDFFKSIKNKDIEMLLITKTVLSDEAKEFCKLLNVTYRENVTIDFDYPMVKLVENEEKIYYIPTDLQYDNIIFNSTNKKYSRVMSCEEATKLGYRHCYKWKGNYL